MGVTPFRLLLGETLKNIHAFPFPLHLQIYYKALFFISIVTYDGKVKGPAVGQIDLDEAVELLAHPLQADYLLQRQMGQNVWNEYILPGQVQKLTSAGEQTL